MNEFTIASSSSVDTASSHSFPQQANESEVKFKDKSILVYPDTESIQVQVSLTPKFRSKSTQITVDIRNKAISPIASHSKYIATSPINGSNENPSLSGRTKFGCRNNLNFKLFYKFTGFINKK